MAAAPAASTPADDPNAGEALTNYDRHHHHGGVTLLIAMSLAGAGIRTWFVARHRGNERQPLMLVTAAASVLIIAGLAALLVPRAPGDSSAASSP